MPSLQPPVGSGFHFVPAWISRNRVDGLFRTAQRTPGALLPEHSHHHEQVVHLYEGEFELTVEGVPILATPGTVFAIPPNARHSGRALSACRIMDVFCPVREDYRDSAGPTIIGDAAKSG